MIEGLLGRKLGMTQGFDEKGNLLALTAIKLGPCVIVQRKTREVDGYSALQLGFEEDKGKKKVNLPMRGHLERCRRGPFRIISEIGAAAEDIEKYKEGQELKAADIFAEGQFVDVVGTSKGRGFAGTIKRWGFKRGPKSHGSKNVRRPGSIGMSATPSRILKGRHMAGHMGSERVTVQNMKVFRIDAENHLVYVVGAVPGARNSFVVVRHATKKPLKAGAEEQKSSEAEQG